MSNKLPFVSSDIPRDLRAFLDRVRELITGSGANRIVTVGDLVSSGIAAAGPGGTIAAPTTGGSTPGTPANVQASGAIQNITVTWDAPLYKGHSHAEVWGADTDNLGDAVQLGMAPGAVFVDSVGPSVTRYYWVRFINTAGTAGAFNAVAGIMGQTGSDVAYLLDTLAGQITESELYAGLNGRIDEIDGGPGGTTGLLSKYTIKVDLAGHVAGYGVAATDNNGTPTSSFGVRADQFWVAPPSTVSATAPTSNLYVGYVWIDTSVSPNVTRYFNGSTWQTTQVKGAVPFVVQAAPTTINGVSVPAGVYIDAAYIQNGTITNAKIGDAAIDNAKIASLSAAKITSGFLSADRIQAGSISAAKLDTAYLTVYDAADFITSGGAAADINAYTTTISGGKITSGTLSVNRIQNNTSGSYNGGTFGLGVGTSIASYQAVGAFSSTSSGVYGLLASSTAGPAFGVGTTTSFEAAGFYNSTSSSYTSHRTYAEIARSNMAGYFSNVSSSRWIQLANATYAYQTSGGASGTFTGAHDALIPKTAAQPAPGDIVVDVRAYATPNIYDSICVNAVSTTASQKGTVGVIAELAPATHVPTALAKIITDEGGRQDVVLDTEKYPDIVDYNIYVMNALGEGMLNVCGQGGDIAVGDLIVASDTPGKGMRQADDLVRACTVAKSRETVTFSSPSEIKQIACIYMAG